MINRLSLGLCFLVNSLSGNSNELPFNTQGVGCPVSSRLIDNLPNLDIDSLMINCLISEDKGPATPLTYLQNYAIISTKHPQWEYLEANQYTTNNDHGGAEMYLAIVEIGYGNSPMCQINGVNLSQKSIQTMKDPNGVVIGFYRIYNASGNESGTWTYQNTSCVNPWNTMNDSCIVK